MNPEYYYLSAYRIEDNQIIFLRVYHKHQAKIAWLLIEYDFKLAQYPEKEFNKMYYNTKQKQHKDYKVLSFDQDTTITIIEDTLKKAYENN